MPKSTLQTQPGPQPIPTPPATPQQPETSASTATDLLRAKAYGLTPQEEVALTNALTATIHKAIAMMTALKLQEVARFIDLSEHNFGCATPVEAFITHLIDVHYEYGGLTPDTVAGDLDPENTDGFRRNFDDAIEVAQRLRTAYPKLVA